MRYRIDYSHDVPIGTPPAGDLLPMIGLLPSPSRPYTVCLRISTDDGARFVMRVSNDGKPSVEFQTSATCSNVLADLLRDANEAADLRAQLVAQTSPEQIGGTWGDDSATYGYMEWRDEAPT